MVNMSSLTNRRTKIQRGWPKSHVLKIRQAEPMYGKEKIKRELEKDSLICVELEQRVEKFPFLY